MVEDTTVRAWSNFLECEKLARAMPFQELLGFCIELAKIGPPKFKPYKDRLNTRRLVCETALSNGIDLAKYKHNGKIAMGRGLLDIWNIRYTERFGGNYGTTGAKEASRRDIKTRLHKARQIRDQAP